MRIGSAAGTVATFAIAPPVNTRGSANSGRKRAIGSLSSKRALLPQQHRRHRGDRLGHRVDPPQRVGLDRQVGLEVAAAAGRLVGELAVARDLDEVAGEAAVVDVAVEVRADALEPRGVEAAHGASSRISQPAKSTIRSTG